MIRELATIGGYVLFVLLFIVGALVIFMAAAS